MNRVYKTQYKMLEKIAEYEQLGLARDTSLSWERIHLVSCARNGYFLALKRGVDVEMAAIACSVHDYGRIITGQQQGHAAAGYEPLKVFLAESGYFSAAEIEMLSVTTKNHSNKAEVGTDLEEIVKDADILDCYQYQIPLTKGEYKARLAKILVELDVELQK